MSIIVPSQVFLTRGCGQHKEKLVSFELALREAGIAPYNLVRVSSIFPPHCQVITKAAGLKLLKAGQILFVVLSEGETAEPGRAISASIGMAVPDDPTCYGYLAEHDGGGPTEKEAGLHTEYLAAEMLATKMGKTLQDPVPGRSGFKMSNGMTLKTRSVAQVAVGAEGLWTTALAAAVLIA